MRAKIDCLDNQNPLRKNYTAQNKARKIIWIWMPNYSPGNKVSYVVLTTVVFITGSRKLKIKVINFTI